MSFRIRLASDIGTQKKSRCQVQVLGTPNPIPIPISNTYQFQAAKPKHVYKSTDFRKKKFLTKNFKRNFQLKNTKEFSTKKYKRNFQLKDFKKI